MSKITDFTFDEFWDLQDKYEDMMVEIEARVREIANSLGHAYQPHHLSDIRFDRDEWHIYVIGEFTLDDGKIENVKIKTDWLFTDDYIKEIEEDEARKAQKEAQEYQEYLRLKAKFEKRKKR